MLRDIQTLNAWALEGRLEVTAISLATYPFVQERYALLPHGASMGFGYGPVVVARERLEVEQLRDYEIAVPGTMTTAFLALRIVLGDIRYREMAFERIPQAVADGEVDVGLVIHEGQLTFEDYGLRRVLDLGEWWLLETGLPLPLGVNVARRDLGDERLAASRPSSPRRSRPGSTTAPRPSSTRSSSGGASTPPSPTGSCRCTSTS